MLRSCAANQPRIGLRFMRAVPLSLPCCSPPGARVLHRCKATCAGPAGKAPGLSLWSGQPAKEGSSRQCTLKAPVLPAPPGG